MMAGTEMPDLAIHKAAMHDQDCVDDIQLIVLTKGCSIDQTCSNGKTALMVAAMWGNYNIVKYLIKAGCNLNTIDSDGCLALHHAVKKYHTSIAKLLVGNGSQLDIANTDGDTCLHLAVQTSNFELVNKLMSHSANNQAVNQYGCTPLMIACKNGLQNIANHIIKNCPDTEMLNTKNRNGYSALHFAAETKQAGVVDKLLKNGARVDVTNDDGATPLLLATQKGHSYIVGVLIFYGADTNTPQIICKDTPCHIAAKNGEFEIIYCLTKQGNADINIQNSDGNTPLHLATMHKQEAVVKFLMTLNPKMLLNNNGLTPSNLPNVDIHFDISDKEISRLREYSIRKKEKCILSRLNGSVRESKRKIVQFQNINRKPSRFLSMKETQKSYNEVTQDAHLPLRQQTSIPGANSLHHTGGCEKNDAIDTAEEDTVVNKIQQLSSAQKLQEELNRIEEDVTKFTTVFRDTDDDTRIKTVASDTNLHAKIDELDRKMNRLSIEVSALTSDRRRFSDIQIQQCAVKIDPGNVNDRVLYELAKKLGKDWTHLGTFLGFEMPELERLTIDNPNDVLSAIKSMLIRWRDRKMKDSSNDEKLEHMFECLTKVDRFDIVGYLKEYITEKEDCLIKTY